mmetsp:Transcript_36810/g.112902  ORF Transcript_36810/g.112902 Transcript_36810/m.112902 type:complete len:249 (+) Transcript_36810:255-1001(+)
MPDEELSHVIKLLGGDPKACEGRRELVQAAGGLIFQNGAKKWRRAQIEVRLRNKWKRLDDAQKAPYEKRAAAAREAAEGGGGGVGARVATGAGAEVGGSAHPEAPPEGGSGGHKRPAESAAAAVPAKQRLKIMAATAGGGGNGGGIPAKDVERAVEDDRRDDRRNKGDEAAECRCCRAAGAGRPQTRHERPCERDRRGGPAGEELGRLLGKHLALWRVEEDEDDHTECVHHRTKRIESVAHGRALARL